MAGPDMSQQQQQQLPQPQQSQNGSNGTAIGSGSKIVGSTAPLGQHHRISSSLFDAFPSQSSNGSSVPHHNAALPAHLAGVPQNDKSALDDLASQLAQTSISNGQKHNPNPAVPAMWPRRSGVVKFFNSTKGFGFIWDTNSAEIGDVDIFVHWTTIQGEVQFKSLAEGEMVEYDLGRGPKGFQALNVTGPNGGNVQGDPMARMPLSLSRNRLFAPGRFNPLAMGLPIAPYGLGPYSAHPAMDPAFAAHMMQSARYNPHSQASFYPVHPSISSSRNMPPVGFQQVAAAERYTGSPIGPDAGFGQPYPGRSLNAASHPNAAVPTAIPAQSSAGRASLFPGYGSGPTTSTLSTTSFSNTFDSQPGALYKQSSPLQAKPSGTSTDSLGLFSNGWRDGLRDGLA